MLDLVALRVRYGYRRLHVLPRREGWRVHHKLVYRIYTEEGLAVRTKTRTKWVSALRVVLPVATMPNERWSINEVGNSIPGKRIVAVLGRLAKTHGLPQIITTDNGTEFTFRAVDECAHRNGVQLDFIRPGIPIENAYIESFNGRLHRECLDESWFLSIEDAKIRIEGWLKVHNEHRPHSSLKDETPRGFAEDRQLSRTAKTAGILT